jgi:hypothetical protein
LADLGALAFHLSPVDTTVVTMAPGGLVPSSSMRLLSPALRKDHCMAMILAGSPGSRAHSELGSSSYD